MKRLVLAAALALAACGPVRYTLVSRDANYSQDPSLEIRLSRVAEVSKGRTSVDFDLANHRAETLPLSELKTVLLDPSSHECPLVSAPEGEVAPGATRAIALVFDTSHAGHGEFSMRLVLPVPPSQIGPNHHETRIWPIVFTTR